VLQNPTKFFVAFFSATIDGRNLIFGHKLHIDTPYRGKRFLTRQIPTSCLPKSGGINPKTLPTIWGTYMKLVTKYHISVINSCWEKCDERCAYMFNVYRHQLILLVAFLDPSDSYFLFADLVGFYTHWTYMHIFRRIFLSNVGIWRVQKRYQQYGIPIWCFWPNIRFLPSTVTEKNATTNILDGRKDGQR
jgi:hypothetical protein